ncbi:hypothetical protein CKA34_03695 [Rhizobium sp. 11515TR]|nr:hypothetical protein CKA34_03695 [Rhizobium sp. 11515TR]
MRPELRKNKKVERFRDSKKSGNALVSFLPPKWRGRSIWSERAPEAPSPLREKVCAAECV